MPYPTFFLVMAGVGTLLTLALVVCVSWGCTGVQRLCAWWQRREAA